MRRVLVVDDDPFMLEGIRRILGPRYDVALASSGPEGLTRLREQGPFMAVVSDLNMQGMSGLEFLEQAREVAPQTPRVMFTGYASTETVSSAINRASVFRFLQKPTSTRDFMNCLDDCAIAYEVAMQAATADGSETNWIKAALALADFDAEFSVHYQPRVDTFTGSPHAAEALIRWTHPERGFISPVDFIPAAEADGTIREITNWVLLKTCRNWTAWKHDRNLDLSLSVNISPALFENGNLVGMVRSALSRTGMDPSRLELEITEGLEVKDGHVVRETLEGLRNLGVKLSIDDFGTGFASMNYLQSLDVDCVKIDRSFVTNAPDNDRDRAILSAVWNLARDLGLKTVAEGIENDRHQNLIQAVGIDEMQGYLFAKPLESASYVGWVEERSHLLAPPPRTILLT